MHVNGTATHHRPGSTVTGSQGAVGSKSRQLIASGGGAGGMVAIYNDAGTTDILLDIAGYFYPV